MRFNAAKFSWPVGFHSDNNFKYNCLYSTMVKSMETLINTSVYYKHLQEKSLPYHHSVTSIDLVAYNLCIRNFECLMWGGVSVPQEVIYEVKC